MSNNDDTINKLAWITCPYCGSSFRVAVPSYTTEAKPIRKEKSQHNWEFDTGCPGCKKGFVVSYDVE